jgi:hypothetical protein
LLPLLTGAVKVSRSKTQEGEWMEELAKQKSDERNKTTALYCRYVQ